MPTAQYLHCTATEWRWQLLPDVEVLENISELYQAGYQPVPEDFPPVSACIAGQLGRLRRIQLLGKPTQLFASEQALMHALAYPVALTTQLPTYLLPHFEEGAGTLLLEGELPLLIPPHLGQIGLVAESGGWQVIPYDALDDQAKQARQELEHLLRTLQRNPGGEPFATFGWLCHIAGSYATLHDRWQEELRTTEIPRFDRWIAGLGRRPSMQERVSYQQKLQQQLALLERTHHQITQLRNSSSEEKQAWYREVEALWPQVEARAHQVAAAYYRVARPNRRDIKVTPLVYTSSLLTPAARQREMPSFLRVLADPVSQAILTALRDKQPYRLDPTTGATFRTSLALPNATGHLELTFPAETQGECLETLGEALIDTWLVIQDQTLQTHDLSAPFTTSLDTLLAARGRQPAQKLRLLQLNQIRTLARAQLRLWLPLRLAPQQEPMSIPLLHLTMIETELNSVNPLMQLALGTWVRLIPQKTAGIPRLIVDLHSKYRIAKRLGLWLALYLHQYPQGTDVQMQTVLKQAGIPLTLDTKARNEMRNAVTRAFKLLSRELQVGPGEEGEEQAEQHRNKRQRGIDEEIIWDYLDSQHDMAAVLGQYWVKRADEQVRDNIKAFGQDWFERWLSLTWHLVPPIPLKPNT